MRLQMRFQKQKQKYNKERLKLTRLLQKMNQFLYLILHALPIIILQHLKLSYRKQIKKNRRILNPIIMLQHLKSCFRKQSKKNWGTSKIQYQISKIRYSNKKKNRMIRVDTKNKIVPYLELAVMLVSHLEKFFEKNVKTQN